MKIWTRNESYLYDYPEDMAKILNYLNANGKLFVSGITIEKLYREFSSDAYCAGWMGVSEEHIEEFARWLEEYDL
mgnify:CR=1 FL=1